MSGLLADGFPRAQVRRRALSGPAAVFPADGYGRAVFGGTGVVPDADELDRARLVPPVFTPDRFAKLVDLGREPSYLDVDLETDVGGFRSALPVYVSALGSTDVAAEHGDAVARQAAAAGVVLVVGENVTVAGGYRGAGSLVQRIETYLLAGKPDLGGVVVQQSMEDADAEVWNHLYSDPVAADLLDAGRLGFELKIGQGAKPGLGGMTVLRRTDTARLHGQYLVDPEALSDEDVVLRSATPGTFTEEILRGQIRLMRNNFPRAKVWVKLPPVRDVAIAAGVAWAEGADAVTVDGAEAGTGWAPTSFLDHVGLPLAECLRRIGASPPGCLLTSGRMWEGARAVKAIAGGARAVGLGRAALLAVEASATDGLLNLLRCMEVELRMLTSALGRYAVSGLSAEDVWPSRHSGGGAR
ncbi:glutamate synthase-related protein [Amycolatopsis sp. NPDC088138]|uniref:glutamate synthase-related protein n=1 Tax=Amycolatopsis sp. NPDC088138 TaxID=3363938 RepID=UPI0037FD12F2